ncbi:MAG: glycerol-3-phosphate 1-O-acyltransferase PlsY [Ruminococcaceae bacterium]|nr:glycerol-3-phosphate 1-O-acyltransferase PlsY [Oscillospiraceae bacterium]
MTFGELSKFGYLFTKLCGDTILPAIKIDGNTIPLSYDTRLLKLLETDKGVWAIVALLLCGVFAYLIGSLNFAVIFSKIFFKEDIRKYGSGNAGATNMVRTYGRKWGVITFIFDGLKAAFSVILSMLLMGEGGAYIAALFAILGHVFPIYYKFKGGKGVVVSAISILCLNPVVFLILVVIFVSIVATSKYISLGSVICAFFYPMLLNAFNSDKGFLATVISILISVIVIVMHKENIKRLLNRTENKIGQKAKKSEGQN